MRAPGSCRKCGGRFHEGHLVDHGHGAYYASKWQKGPPQSAWWGGIRAKKSTMMTVRTYRCDRCGMLESYAH